MEFYKNVKIEKKINIYFDGKVTSRNIYLHDGTKKTLGLMFPGEYKFDTEKREIMEIISGDLRVLLPKNDDWISIKAGDSFEIESNSSFELEIVSLTNYCCSYFD